MAVKTTEITGKTTLIPGLIIFDISSIEDERGYYQEKYQKQKLVKAGLPESFNIVQNSVSYNKNSGAIRGFHAEPWDKYISTVSGKVFAAYVDLRKGESFGKVVTVEINSNIAVFLPKGVANSFQTLTDNTYYLYSVNDFWSADLYDKYTFVNLADPDINVAWPIPLSSSIMSERDKNHPFLRDIKAFEG